MHVRCLTTAVWTVLLGMGVALAVPAVAQQGAGFGVRLLEIPAERAEDPRASSYIIDHVPPGTTLERSFEVINDDPNLAEVALYAAAAAIVDDAFVPDAGRGGNELSSWITVTPAEATVQPAGRLQATLRIDVPPSATPGERYAVVLAERQAPEDVPSGQFGLATRVGIRVYLSVGGGGEPATDFQITSLAAVTGDDALRSVVAVVANTGGRALDFAGDLTLSGGPGALTAGPFEVTPGTTLAPGEEVVLAVPLDSAIPAGPWQADLRLTSGVLVREARATLTFPTQPGQGAPQDVSTASTRNTAILVLAAALVVLAAGLATFQLVRLRRGRLSAGSPSGPSGSPQSPDGQPSVSSAPATWAPPSAGKPAVPPPPAAAGPRDAAQTPPPPP